jgi:hypothetical protein
MVLQTKKIGRGKCNHGNGKHMAESETTRQPKDSRRDFAGKYKSTTDLSIICKEKWRYLVHSLTASAGIFSEKTREEILV